MATTTTPPPVTASVTNAAGTGGGLLAGAGRIAFVDGALAAGGDAIVAGVVSAFKARARGDRTARMLLVVRADANLAPSGAWEQVGARMDALTASLRAAGLKDSRYLFGFEPDAT